jgi:predicted SprT family Zn-dependent metalloprotease
MPKEGEGMKIPESLRIMGHDVEVIHPYVFVERDDCHGLASLDSDKILLSAQNNGELLKESQIAENLLHEIGHHISWIVTGNVRLADDEPKHSMIFRLLFQIIRDNDLDFREEPK